MGTDIRLPIGGMFTILGLILLGFGVFTSGNTELYLKSMSVNVNLWWGIVMLIFGGVMLALALTKRKSKSE